VRRFIELFGQIYQPHRCRPRLDAFSAPSSVAWAILIGLFRELTFSVMTPIEAGLRMAMDPDQGTAGNSRCSPAWRNYIDQQRRPRGRAGAGHVCAARFHPEAPRNACAGVACQMKWGSAVSQTATISTHPTFENADLPGFTTRTEDHEPFNPRRRVIYARSAKCCLDPDSR
jgi:hypothetical protein